MRLPACSWRPQGRVGKRPRLGRRRRAAPPCLGRRAAAGGRRVPFSGLLQRSGVAFGACRGRQKEQRRRKLARFATLALVWPVGAVQQCLAGRPGGLPALRGPRLPELPWLLRSSQPSRQRSVLWKPTVLLLHPALSGGPAAAPLCCQAVGPQAFPSKSKAGCRSAWLPLRCKGLAAVRADWPAQRRTSGGKRQLVV